MHFDDVMFSKTGLDSPLGKLGKSFKTDVDFDTGEKFERRCNNAGTTAAAILRDYIFEVEYGKTFADFCHDAAKVRRNTFFGKRSDGSAMGPSDSTKDGEQS